MKMKGILLFFFFLTLLSFNIQKNTLKLNNNIYDLYFVDNFNGKKLDLNKWTYRKDSRHWSTQLERNVNVRNGLLYLNLKKEKLIDKDYTGAGIISLDTFKYGYYESRLKVPKGRGWHTSFWLMKYNALGKIALTIEIDILENDSKDGRGYSVNFHKWANGHVDMTGKYVSAQNLNKDFQIVSCEYTPEYVKYFLDGREVRTIGIENMPKSSLNIWLTSIASYLGGTESVDDLRLPEKAIFDYVKYYKLRQ